MAKRRKLTTPSADDLTRMEEEFRRETSAAPGPMAPISQVAAEAATMAPVVDAETRAQAAKDSADAKLLRESTEAGLLIHEIPIDEIRPDDLVRDRATLIEEEMNELRSSIAANDLRLPIEVYELENPDGIVRYGIISGYRRYMAFRQLFDVTRATRYATIKCLIREPGSASNAFAAMVEENEVRAGLSPYERGRIAGLTVQMGVYASTDEAVNTLFASASKAKRSKIRSFALIFEELGDMLTYPEVLSEKQGLRLSAALRGGGAGDLRAALDDVIVEAPGDEWAVLDPVVTKFEENARDDTRGGRPAKKPRSRPQQTTTSSGFTVRREEDSRGYLLRISGSKVNSEMMDLILAEVTRLLEKPD